VHSSKCKPGQQPAPLSAAQAPDTLARSRQANRAKAGTSADSQDSNPAGPPPR